MWNSSHVNATEDIWWQVNIGSGNGLLPSGSKSLSGPISHCWPRSMSPHGANMPQCVNKTISQMMGHWLLFHGSKYHDDVIKWKHFPRYWSFVRGIHLSPVNSPHKGQWRGALMFSLVCARINGWLNNHEAGDLRRHRAHYDVIVMSRQVTFILEWHHISAMVSEISDKHCLFNNLPRLTTKKIPNPALFTITKAMCLFRLWLEVK